MPTEARRAPRSAPDFTVDRPSDRARRGEIRTSRSSATTLGWKILDPANISPKRMVLLLATAIFVAETAVMYILHEFQVGSPVMEAFVDSTFLLIFLAPVYFLLYRPFWELHQRQEKEIRRLSRGMLNAIEDERKRISHELHDQCGQTLTALQFGLEASAKGLAQCDGTHADRLRTLAALTHQLGGELRDVTSRLRPVVLDQIGLVAALRGYVAEFTRNHPGIDVEQQYPDEGQIGSRLESELELALYRIAQESLTNVAKHASATEARVRLACNDSEMILSIRDNGRGFDIRELERTDRGSGSLGLLGLRERAAAIDGHCEVVTRLDQGTTIIATVPKVLRDNHARHH